MSWNNKVETQEQDQRTYENLAEARRVTLTDKTGSNIDSTNPLPVNVTSVSPDQAYRQHGTALCTFNTETTLLSYTVPNNKKFILTGLNFGGEADGEFTLYVNLDRQLIFRNSAANKTQFLTINDNNFELQSNDIIDIKVTNVSHRQNAANFETTIIGGII
jgi:hypothetical protein